MKLKQKLLESTEAVLHVEDSDAPPVKKRKSKKAKEEEAATPPMTPEEAEKFWPLYNSFEAQRRDLRHQMHDIRRSITNESSEDDYKKALNELQKIDMQQSALKLKYHKEFLKILSAKKLFNYYSAENEYKKELIKHIEQGCRR